MRVVQDADGLQCGFLWLLAGFNAPCALVLQLMEEPQQRGIL